MKFCAILLALQLAIYGSDAWSTMGRPSTAMTSSSTAAFLRVPRAGLKEDDAAASSTHLKSAVVSQKVAFGSSSDSDAVDHVLSVSQADVQEAAGVTAHSDGYCFGRESVEQAINAIKRGEMVVVVDDMNRENEGDLIMAADACTPETMATIVRYSSGVVCVGMSGERMDELNLPPMLVNNEDPKGTAFSVTVDATKAHGISTGISAGDRSKTCNLLANSKSTKLDFSRPGHIFPLRAREGGVLTRDGHTEAAVDLSKLAGRGEAGILCELVSEENPTEMMRLPELTRFSKKHGMVLTSIVDLAQYRRDTEVHETIGALKTNVNVDSMNA